MIVRAMVHAKTEFVYVVKTIMVSLANFTNVLETAKETDTASMEGANVISDLKERIALLRHVLTAAQDMESVKIHSANATLVGLE